MVKLNTSNFPQLTTDRIILRQMLLTDLEDYIILRTHPVMLEYLHRSAPDRTGVKKWLDSVLESEKKNQVVSWSCVDKNTNDFIGNICFWNIEHENYRAEIGYSILPDQQGNGYMKEMMNAAIHFGFHSMNLHTISAYVNPENLASLKVLQRANFTEEGHLKECIYFNGSFYDLKLFGLRSPLLHVIE